MVNGVYEVPRELKDEDKWFRFFTKKQLFVVGIAAGICAFLFFILTGLGLFVLALILSVGILVLAVFYAFFIMPDNKYMYGGGYAISTLIMRLINKRFLARKVIYVKFNSEDEP